MLRLTVVCDECGVSVNDSLSDRDLTNVKVAVTRVRNLLWKFGWKSGDSGKADYCPTCWEKMK